MQYTELTKLSKRQCIPERARRHQTAHARVHPRLCACHAKRAIAWVCPNGSDQRLRVQQERSRLTVCLRRCLRHPARAPGILMRSLPPCAGAASPLRQLLLHALRTRPLRALLVRYWPLPLQDVMQIPGSAASPATFGCCLQPEDVSGNDRRAHRAVLQAAAPLRRQRLLPSHARACNTFGSSRRWRTCGGAGACGSTADARSKACSSAGPSALLDLSTAL